MALLVVVGALLGGALDFASPLLTHVRPDWGHPVSLREAVEPASASATASCHLEVAPAPRMMPLDEALSAYASCAAAFVDARGDAAFEEGHIAGAFHLPAEGAPDAAAVLAKLKRYRTVVVYDADSKGCRLAQGVADRLVEGGCRDVRVLEGSWTAWDEAGGPAAAGRCSANPSASATTASSSALEKQP